MNILAMSKLSTWREGQNLTLEAGAQMFQISPSYLSMLENGERTPSLKLALSIQEKTNGYVTTSDHLKKPRRTKRT